MEKRRQAILLVDDAPANIKVLREALGREYEILFATNGKDALGVAAEQSPDLILLDVMMPGMDGYQVCAALKQDPRTQGIPVIFITSMDQEEDEARGLNIGAIDYIFKPIRPAIVQARVRNHLELKRYRDFLENLSLTDGLTGIHNRRRFDETLEREWRRAQRHQAPISLVILDVDLFKSYNDHYGHLAGDDCLRRIAQCLPDCVRRPTDLVARYGGEEFGCILPDTVNEGAVQVGMHMLETVNRLNIPHAHSPVADHVTVSIGAATCTPLVGQTGLDLIERADAMLYTAKANGRNRISGRAESTP